MKTIKVTLKGTEPLLMHSCAGANPLNPISKKLKEYSSKRKKTEEDYTNMCYLEWELGLYYNDEVGIYIPRECIEAALVEGGKPFRKGSDIQKYCSVTEIYIPLDYGCKKTKDELKYDERFRDIRAVNIKQSKVMRTRPRFNNWGLTFNLVYNENKIDFDTIVQALDYSGNYVGLCDYRPKYGKYSVDIEELD